MLYSKILLALFVLSMNLNATTVNLVIVVSKSSSINTISKQELAKIFLAKTKKLPNGQKAITLENSQTKHKEEFYKKVTGKNNKQLKKYWAKMIFTGKGFPPKRTKDIKDLIEFIKKNHNAIAYIPKNELLSSNLKVLLEI